MSNSTQCSCKSCAGSGLPVRMPKRPNRTEDDRLPVRESLQMRPVVQVQGRIDGRDHAACCVPNLASAQDSGQYAALLNQKASIMHNYSSVLAVAGVSA